MIVNRHFLRLLSIVVLAVCSLTAAGQGNNYSTTNRNVSYRILFDEPYATNHVWLHVQPLAPEIFATNFALCYGFQGNMLLGKTFDIKVAARLPYGLRSDMGRWNGRYNDAVYYLPQGERKFARGRQTNSMLPYSYLEAVGTYHIKDFELRNQATVVLTSRKRKAADLQVVDFILVTAKERRIIGARGGFMGYQASTDVTVSMLRNKQGLTGSDGTKINSDGFTVMPDGRKATSINHIYSSVRSAGFMLGGSYTSIRNLTIRADKYGNLANNIIFTAYADLLMAPWTSIDDVEMQRPNQTGTVSFNTGSLAMNKMGWRLGADWMYNQDAFISFGAELGMRPGLAGKNLYAVAKIGLPVLSFRARGPVLSTNQGQNLK